MTTLNRLIFLLTSALIATALTAPVVLLLRNAPADIRGAVGVAVFVVAFIVVTFVWSALFVSSDISRREEEG